MHYYNVAVVGASGVVGQQIIKIIEERNFPIKSVKFLGNSSKNQEIIFKNKKHYIQAITEDSFKNIDIAWFCVEADISKTLAPLAIAEGAIVIDNSSAFRMEAKVPLVIPEVNPEDLDWNNGLISNPNCSTIQMLLVLKPIHDHFSINRVVVSTYQSVSGTGTNAISELINQEKDYVREKPIKNKVYPYQILHNVIPHIDQFLDTGYTKEEMKMVDETHKILDDNIKLTATAVRVPVLYSHSEALNIETHLPFDLNYLTQILDSSPGIRVVDDISKIEYPMPVNTTGHDHVYVGRIRRDSTVANALNLWVVGDNIRKGAALNAVQIAETLISRKLLRG